MNEKQLVTIRAVREKSGAGKSTDTQSLSVLTRDLPRDYFFQKSSNTVTGGWRLCSVRRYQPSMIFAEESSIFFPSR